MNTTDTFPFVASRIPATKSAQAELAETLVAAVQDGDINPIDAVVQMKSIAESINAFLKDDRIREAVLSECAKYGKGETPAFRGAKVQQKEAGASFDYMACADPVWTDLMAREQEIAARLGAPDALAKQFAADSTEGKTGGKKAVVIVGLFRIGKRP